MDALPVQFGHHIPDDVHSTALLNGKIERWHKSLKSECIRPKTPLSFEDALRVVHAYLKYCNTVRLHSMVGYVTPKDKLDDREKEIFAERDRKLEAARKRRKLQRKRACTPSGAVA